MFSFPYFSYYINFARLNANGRFELNYSSSDQQLFNTACNINSIELRYLLDSGWVEHNTA